MPLLPRKSSDHESKQYCLILTRMLCQICFHPSRVSRFRTARVTICQWCITELCCSETSPDRVFEVVRLTTLEQSRARIGHQIAFLVRRVSSPPDIDRAALEIVKERALHHAHRQEGFFQSLYRTFVDDSERVSQANILATSMREQLAISHHAALAAHAIEQRDIKTRISDLQAQLDGVADNATSAVKKYFASALVPTPTKSREIRLLRAYALGLVNSTREQISRPEKVEYDALKQSIRKQDGYKCVCCERNFSTVELHVHHIIPLYQFGTNAIGNLVTLCYPCHNKQHDFKVSRNQPIQRKAPRADAAVSATKTTKVHATPLKKSKSKRIAVPTSRKGFVDCPNCLVSIPADTGDGLLCPECGLIEMR